MAEQYKGLTLTEIQEWIAWELGQVSGTTATYTKFTAAIIRQRLTERQNDFVARTKCLKKFAIIQAVANYRRYVLPTICIENGIISVKFYDASTSYTELELVDEEFMNDKYEGYLTDSSSDPQFCWHGTPYGNRQMMEVYPAPDTTGTDYLSNLDTGVYYGADLPGIQNNVTGSASGGDANTLTVAVDTFLTQGIVVGMYVRNITDGSYGYITTITDAKNLALSTLTGGTANVFAAADVYMILSGEYGVHLDPNGFTEKYLFGYIPGVLSAITIPANNFLIEFVPYPAKFPATGNANQYPEIPKKYHKSLVWGVCSDLLGSFHEKSDEFKRAATYEARYQAEVSEAMAASRPFKDKPSSMRPRFR
uniref:Uncharacterized protein n=1 Tax=viral metagenome TaxID=1070528 RepID=A0A6M3KG33_9ZZZZ